MKTRYNGIKKGITLVEMTIAVILFGLLSAITLIYIKNLYNIDLTAKKARVAALMDQASQLSGAFDIYKAEFGVTPTDINLTDFNSTRALILTELPADMRELSTKGWELNTSTGFGSNNAFQFALDLNGTSYTTLTDDEQYCAIFNHDINTSLDLNVSGSLTFGTWAQQQAALGKSFCYTAANGIHTIIIMK